MSLYGALFSGVSGLTAQSSAMGSIADNVANVNTIGYKANQIAFQTLVTKQTVSSKYATGGVQSKTQSGIDVQGLLQSSTRATDMGLAGNGFFVVSDQAKDPNSFAFSRAGAFALDQDGFLKNVGGYYLQGWPLESWDGYIGAEQVIKDGRAYMKAYKNDMGDMYYINGNAIDGSNMQPLNLTTIGGTARATSLLSFGANLPAGARVGATEKMNTQIFDSLGNEHNLLYSFMKRDTNKWDFEVLPPSGTTYTAIKDQNPNGRGNYFSAGRLDFTAVPKAGSTYNMTIAGQTYTFNFIDTGISNPPNSGFLDFGGNNSTTLNFPATAGDTISIGGVEFKLVNTPTTSPTEININGLKNATEIAEHVSRTAETYFDSAYGPGNWMRTNGAQILSSLPVAAGTTNPGNSFTAPSYDNTINDNPAGAVGQNVFNLTVGQSLTNLLDTLAAQINTAMAYKMNTGAGPSFPPNPPGNLASRVKGEEGIWFRQFDSTLEMAIDASNLMDNTPGASKPAVMQTKPYTIPALTSPSIWTDTNNSKRYGIEFNGDGSLDKIFGYDEKTANDPRPEVHMGWANGALDMNGDIPTNGGSAAITWFLGNYNYKDGMQQLAGKFNENFKSQNGNRFGLFTALSIGEDGIVTAHFENGVITPIFMIPVATFANVNGMTKLTGNVFQQSDLSGLATLRQSGEGGAGRVTQAALESSTVDLGEEFTTMITTQRAYSAAAKIITTSDQMLDELIMIKR